MSAAAITPADVDALARIAALMVKAKRTTGAWQPLPHQTPPPGDDWLYWLLLAGRGAGKTEAGARYLDAYLSTHPRHRAAIIAPTLGDARSICVEGDSGLLAVNPRLTFNRSWGELRWPNGSRAQLFGAYTPEDAERLRGPQHHVVWWDEFASARQLDAVWNNMRLGLRLGSRPHMVITTTPRPRPRLLTLLQDPRTVTVTARTDDNPHLHADVRAELYGLYAGTRLGRQELAAELLTDVPGALWTRDRIEQARTLSAPPLTRIVVAIDPAATSGENAADTGIVVAGVVGHGADAHGYILDDRSVHASPHGWASAAVAAYHTYRADRIVAETNNGGEMVGQTIRTVDPRVAYTAVHASRGKATRAEPVAALYEQGRVHHVGAFPELEDQLCSWLPGEDSPDRLDALVWALTDLMLDAPTWGAS